MGTAQVETLLKTHDGPDGDVMEPSNEEGFDLSRAHGPPPDDLQHRHSTVGGRPSPPSPADPLPFLSGPPPSLTTSPLDGVLASADAFTWEMIRIGVDEPLPAQDVIDHLCVPISLPYNPLAGDKKQMGH